jgi:outer membrane protein OmpA-like peptidoglycan-associated protein
MVRQLVIGYWCWLLVIAATAQDLEFEALNKLPSSINTSCEEILPLVSPDGRTLYFVRASCGMNDGGAAAGSDIWASEYNPQTKEWSRPKNTGIVFNDKGNNAVVGISADGNTIYQINTSPAKRIKGVYFSKKVNGKWTQPDLEPVGFLETEQHFGMYVSRDFRTIIASMKRSDGTGEEDLYVSRKDGAGQWSEPKNLGTTINTIGFEISPFLSPDGKRLYFASNGHRGLGGSDIFYSNRLDDSWTNWSAPVNLGNVINTEGFDAYFSMNDSVAWFSSSNGVSSDIYRARVKKPEDPRKVAVNSIVEEATSMIADLTDDTYDSLQSFKQSIFVSFEKNTAVLSAEAVSHLNEAVSLIKSHGQGKLKLVAYVNSYGGENSQLWDKRLEEIRSYLRQKSGLDLLIDQEIMRVDMNQSASKTSVVEVKYN